MKYNRISFSKQINHLWPLMIDILGGLGIGYYLAISNQSELPYELMIPWVLFHSIPTVALHLNYFLLNKADILCYDPNNNEILFAHKGNDYIFPFESIKIVHAHKSFAFHKGNIQLLAWDSYNHVVIEFNNGTKIVLTSLLMGINNHLPIPTEKILVKMNFFRWTKGESLEIPNSTYIGK